MKKRKVTLDKLDSLMGYEMIENLFNDMTLEPHERAFQDMLYQIGLELHDFKGQFND